MKILAIAIVLLSSADEADAETFWPMHDSVAIDHDLRSRWNDPVRWCGNAVARELSDLMATVQRVDVGQMIALVTANNTARAARESLVDPDRSYGFWRLSASRTLVVAIACDAPTVCTMTASLIVRDGAAAACFEQWSTVAYREGKPK